MKVIVLGAGIIGLTTAYYLAKNGCEVTIIDRNCEAGKECSFANGGQLSYSYVEPLANFGNLKKAIFWLGKKNAPLLIRPSFDLDLFRWIWEFLKNCPQNQYENNMMNVMKISMYSRLMMQEFRKEFKFKFHHDSHGIMHCIEDEDELNSMKNVLQHVQRHYECDFKVLTPAATVKKSPSLKHIMKHKIAAIHTKYDETGDAFMFIKGLEKELKNMGVKFYYDTEVLQLTSHKMHVTGVDTNHGFLTANKFAVCMGAYTSNLLKSHGLYVPIYPMKGYSITVPLKADDTMLDGSVYDHQSKIVYTKLGRTLRVAGTAEFNKFDQSVCEERIDPLITHFMNDFPNVGDLNKISKWSCLRPQIPSSVPIIGKAWYNNLYVNSGHGTLGWTQALGSSRIIADLIMSIVPEIDVSGFALKV